jgi:RNA polymerase sigma-70 factor (ECF subfamily)
MRAERRRTAHEQLAAEARAARLSPTADPADAAGLNDSLATLDPTARQIVVLRVWGGLAWQEIAELVGASKSSAQRTYVRALEQLRNHWEPQSC